MRLSRLSVVGLMMLCSASACTSGDPKPNYSTVVPTAATLTSPAESSSLEPVPIDKIPPGSPESWVPAGVPTSAPFKEAGDKVPMFTLAMFSDKQVGALAAARYYLDARNWADALLDPKPFLIICDAAKCKNDAVALTRLKRAGQYVTGVREFPGAPSVVKGPSTSGADWVVQVKLSVTAGRLLDKQGTTLKTESASSELTNIYVTWNGKMWRVTGDYLAG
jgi:hypothetical protein